MKFEQALERFLNHLATNDRTAKTLYGYQSDLRAFRNFYEEKHNIEWYVEDTSSEDIEEFLQALYETRQLQPAKESDTQLSPVILQVSAQSGPLPQEPNRQCRKHSLQTEGTSLHDPSRVSRAYYCHRQATHSTGYRNALVYRFTHLGISSPVLERCGL